MQINRQPADLRRGVVLVVLATMAAFPVAITAAIACYPGRDEGAHGYRFGNDFLSALGETRTPAGHDNFRACLIFQAVQRLSEPERSGEQAIGFIRTAIASSGGRRLASAFQPAWGHRSICFAGCT